MKYILFLCALFMIGSCGDKPTPTPVPPAVPNFSGTYSVNANPTGQSSYFTTTLQPQIKFVFPEAINTTTLPAALSIVQTSSGSAVSYNTTWNATNKELTVVPVAPLAAFSSYTVNLSTALKSVAGGKMYPDISFTIKTSFDTTDKFPRISTDALLDKVQSTTLKYFTTYAHPVSGLARERTGSGETVTSGGSGFGIMAIIAGISRNFISRTEGFNQINKMVSFLKNTAVKHHGAFPHWLNGTTGQTIAFSANDNGGDLVETSFLIQGLITARQYFNGSTSEEISLRNNINDIVNGVEWDWYRNGNQQALYWHWSPTVGWAMNMKIQGWNECLVTYILAASSTTHNIPASVYQQGWARSGAMANGASYYGYTLPLGPDRGGPLFWAHYSFLGVNPTGLSDTYANYWTQVRNHTLINYQHCVQNPNNYVGYSDKCWGLTASDIQGGYTASSPTNDNGTIAPTAALSSYAYTPTESQKALEFFYYKLGDKVWTDNYGFIDAFNLQQGWFASSHLAIDQGPIIVMIENYRSGLLWNLFTSAPEVKTGMRSLGFTAPYL